MTRARQGNIIFNFEEGKLIGPHHEAVSSQFDIYKMMAESIYGKPSDLDIEALLKKNGFEIKIEGDYKTVPNRIY